MGPGMKRFLLLKLLLSFSITLFAFSLVLSPILAYQSWTYPVDISNLPTGSHSQRIVVDRNCGLHVIWIESGWPTSPTSELYYATKPANESWSTPERVSTILNSSFGPALAIDSQNNLHAVWTDETFPIQKIYYSSKSLTGVWSEPIVISQPENYSHFPSIAIDSQDTLYVAWSYTLPGQNDIFYIYKSVGGSWSQPVNISNTSNPSYNPSLVTDASGNIYAVWQELVAPDNFEIFFNQKSAGGNWGNPIDISNTPSGSPTPAWWLTRLVSDPQGNLHVGWREEFYDASGTTQYGTFYVSKTSSGWSQVEKISTAFAGGPDFVVDQAGTVHVVWGQAAGNMNIFYKSKPLGGSWSAPLAISQLLADSFEGSITADSQNLYVVFMNNSVGDSDIFFVTSKIPYKVTWLPPLSTQEIYTMHDGATLPVKFNLTNPDGSQATDAAVNVVITENATETEWFSGPAVYDPTLPGYSAKVSTKGWPLGEYTISLVGDRLVHDATYGLVLVETGKGKGKQK